MSNFGCLISDLNSKSEIKNFEIRNALGGYQSGQMGRTVNPLLRLRRFESFSPHGLID